MRGPRAFGRSPRVAIWETTRACDLRCLHCRASAMATRDPAELSYPEALDLLDQLQELAPDVVVLTGGDPFKRPDLPHIVREARARGLRLALAPSVTPLLTAAALRALVAAGIDRVALSLDGPDPRTHDAFRGVGGSFDRTLEAIDIVKSTGAALQVNTSLDRSTVGTLGDTGRLVAALSPALWSVFIVVPVGRAGADRCLDAVTCEEVFHRLHEWGESTGLPVKTTAGPAFRRVALQRRARAVPTSRSRRAAPPSWVNEGRGFVFVSHTGEVQPSGFLPLSAGNVRTERLARIYRDARLFRGLRDEARLEGKCGLCAFRVVCGGSRARAFAATGNPFAEDPACAYDPVTNRPRGGEPTHRRRQVQRAFAGSPSSPKGS